MAECSRSIRPPPVREAGLAQQTAYAVADDAHSPLENAVGLGAVWRRAKMDSGAFFSSVVPSEKK